MPTCLVAKSDRYLSPPVVVRRLASEFAYIESSEEEGRRYVTEAIRQLQAIEKRRLSRAENEYLDRLGRVQNGALHVYAGDNPTSETMLLDLYVIPREPIILECASPAHEQAIYPLLVRCAVVLGYDIVTT